MTGSYRRHFGLLLLVTAAVLLAGIGLRDPWPADEPRFALIARDMVTGGDWLFPRVGGVVYPDKPPLFFWLIAFLYALTGSLRLSFLLPGVLAGIAVVALVTDLARRLWDERAGILAGAALLTLLQFPLQMKTGQIDPLLCLWTTLGLYGLCRHLLGGPAWRWYAVGGLACGLGVITKGVGFLPLLILVPYAYAKAHRWNVTGPPWRDRRWLLAPAAFLAGIAIWLIPMLVATVDSADAELLAYRDDILLRQTVTRYADAWGHIKPPWYLFTNAVPWLWLPATLLLPWLIPRWIRALKDREPAILLLAGWIALVLLFFSSSAGKRSLYIFPAAPAFAMIVGYAATRILDRRGPRRVLLAWSAALCLIVAALTLYTFLRPEVLGEWVTRPALRAALPWYLATVVALMLSIVAFTGMRRAPEGTVAVTAALWLGLSLAVYPAIDPVRSGRVIIDEVRSVLPEGVRLGFLGWPEQFLLHWDRPAVHFGYRRGDSPAESRDAARWLAAHADARLLLPGSRFEPCFDSRRARALGAAHRREWFLAGPEAVEAECLAAARAPGLLVRYDPHSP